jgi:hypothetical protein
MPFLDDAITNPQRLNGTAAYHPTNKNPRPKPGVLRKALSLLAALLAALSGLLARLLGLLTGLLLATLSGLLARLLGLLPALIWIILSHSYLQFWGEYCLNIIIQTTDFT